MSLATASKIVGLEELKDILSSLKNEGKNIVHCHGVFDLLHPGHIKHFEAAKREGDILVVTITPDHLVNKGPGRPIFKQQIRAETLASLNSVDFVAINQWPTAVEVIKMLRPNVYAKGSDYKNADDDLTGKIRDEQNAIEEVGGRIHFTDEITFSSSEIINNNFDIFSPEAKEFLNTFKQSFSADEIISKLGTLKKLKVLVIGDAIIDEYHSCKAIGMASKSATINAKFIGAEKYAGGALAVANHIAGFCDNVHLVTCLGAEDSQQEFVESSLKGNIEKTFIKRYDGPTTVKRRFIDPFRIQKMFEVTHINDSPLHEGGENDLLGKLFDLQSRYDLVVVCDFGHGMIGWKTVNHLCSSNSNLALNVQTNSANFGHNPVTKYLRGNFICLDEREIRLALHDRITSIEELVKRLRSMMQTDLISVTRGQNGSSTFTSNEQVFNVPVFTKEVVDTIGAGDAYFSLAAPSAASGFDPRLVGFLGNIAGAIASRIVGNKESVDPVVLYKYVTTLLK